jgi:hypothetical protein
MPNPELFSEILSSQLAEIADLSPEYKEGLYGYILNITIKLREKLPEALLTSLDICYITQIQEAILKANKDLNFAFQIILGGDDSLSIHKRISIQAQALTIIHKALTPFIETCASNAARIAKQERSLLS